MKVSRNQRELRHRTAVHLSYGHYLNMGLLGLGLLDLKENSVEAMAY